MQVDFNCKNCNQVLAVESSEKGHELTCPVCNTNQKAPLKGSLEKGNIIDDLLIERELGEGTMGKVYLGSHILMNRQVAIKTINPEFTDNEEYIQQFTKELQVAGQLNHPNIVTVFNANNCEGIYYLSMEYVDGFDMDERIVDGGVLTELEAMTVVSYVAEALNHAWNQIKMVHRDIKPENIRISNDGEIKVMDFGIAAIGGEHKQGEVMGTPDFISPEQGQGKKVDFRSDMYSLGITLIYLLTGKRVFKGGDPYEVVAKHVKAPLPSIFDLNPDIEVSRDTLKIISKMTQKDPNDRFSTWDDLIKAIKSIMNNEGKAHKKAQEKRSKDKVLKDTNTRKLNLPTHLKKKGLQRKKAVVKMANPENETRNIRSSMKRVKDKRNDQMIVKVGVMFIIIMFVIIYVLVNM